MYASYETLIDRLEDEREPLRIVSLPDGSVDTCYTLTGLDGDRLESREEFGTQLLEGAGDTFSLERTGTRPGGQAVNAARQAHALSEDAVLIGHLDHPVLADFPFETYSMGAPTRVHVVTFDGEEVVLAESDSDDWSLEDLESVVGLDVLLEADALCCTNWVSIRGLTDVFDVLGDYAPTSQPVVLDPGAVGAADDDSLADLCETLARAESTVDVVLSVNRAECVSFGEAVGVIETDEDEPECDFESTESLLEAIRSALEITGVVLHATDVAAVAVRNEVTHEIPMLSIDDPTFTTGAGDRFSVGIAIGLVHDWEWETTLALGNACAAHFVATGETGDSSSLRSFVDGRRTVTDRR